MEDQVSGSNSIPAVQRKRSREEDSIITGENAGSKRPHSQGLTPQALELLRVLEDSEYGEICHEGEDCAAAEEVVCGVMRSFQEEICSSARSAEIEARDGEIRPACGAESVDGSNLRVDHMSYLLEASDDELGIPPSSTAVVSPLTMPCEAYSGGDCVALAESPCLRNVCLDGFWQLEEEAELFATGYNDWLEEPGLYVYGGDQLDGCNFVPFSCNSVPFELSDLDGRLPWRQEAAT